jgi:hypothetical protein
MLFHVARSVLHWALYGFLNWAWFFSPKAKEFIEQRILPTLITEVLQTKAQFDSGEVCEARAWDQCSCKSSQLPSPRVQFDTCSDAADADEDHHNSEYGDCLNVLKFKLKSTVHTTNCWSYLTDYKLPAWSPLTFIEKDVEMRYICILKHSERLSDYGHGRSITRIAFSDSGCMNKGLRSKLADIQVTAGHPNDSSHGNKYSNIHCCSDAVSRYKVDCDRHLLHAALAVASTAPPYTQFLPWLYILQCPFAYNSSGLSEMQDPGGTTRTATSSCSLIWSKLMDKLKLRGFSPQSNYSDRATAACRRS